VRKVGFNQMDMKTDINSRKANSGNTNSDDATLRITPVFRVMKPLLIATLGGLLVSCSSMDSTGTRYAGAPHFQPTTPAHVEVLRAQPTRAHDAIGQVVVDASIDPSPPVGDIEARLREEAAKIGADAVVVVHDQVQPEGWYVLGGYWNHNVDTYSAEKVVGVAIKYHEPAETLTPTGNPSHEPAETPMPTGSPTENP
jgi:hypothetical protein